MKKLHSIALTVGLLLGASIALGAPTMSRLITVLDSGNVTGTLGVANGGTGLTASVEDAVLVGSGTSTLQNKTLPSCSGASDALAYNTGTNTFACNTISGTSPLTTKGDLYTYTTVNARLPVGTDGQCLKANSAQATGLEWNTCSATSAYATVQDEGSALTQRATLNFIGSSITCADNAGSSRTDCTISGGSGLTFGEVQRLVFLGQ